MPRHSSKIVRVYTDLEELWNDKFHPARSTAYALTNRESGKTYYVWSTSAYQAHFLVVRHLDLFEVHSVQNRDKFDKKTTQFTAFLTQDEKVALIQKLQESMDEETEGEE